MKLAWISAVSLAALATQAIGQQPSAGVAEFSEKTHILFEISDDQLEEIEKQRRVTLSKQQVNQVRSLAEGFPKRIGVVSPFVQDISESRFAPWPDQITAVWYRKRGIAIPRDRLTGSDRCREFSKELNSGDAVLIDTQGHYSIGPKPIDLGQLQDKLTKLAGKEPDGKNFQIYILRPPVLEASNEEAQIQKSINELTRACDECGLDYQIGG